MLLFSLFLFHSTFFCIGQISLFLLNPVFLFTATLWIWFSHLFLGRRGLFLSWALDFHIFLAILSYSIVLIRPNHPLINDCFYWAKVHLFLIFSLILTLLIFLINLIRCDFTFGAKMVNVYNNAGLTTLLVNFGFYLLWYSLS